MRLISALMLGTALFATTAFAVDLQPIRSITVQGEAKHKVVPDEAHIRVNLNSQEKQMGAAKAANDKKLAKLMGIVKSASIDEKKVRTESSNVQPVYNYKDVQVSILTQEECKAYLQNVTKTPGITQTCPARTERKQFLEGYRVQANLDITVGDTGKLAGLLENITNAGLEKGANTEWGDLLSMYYTLSNPDKLRDDMLSEAIKNARAKADKMAAAAGALIGAVYQINEGGVATYQPQPMPMMAMAANAPMAKAELAVAPPAGEQEVASSVTITYELK